jgi:hypothetical protein
MMPGRQYTPRQQQQMQQQAAMQQPVEIQGKLQGVARNGIMVATNNNQVWRVGILQMTKVRLTGTTTANLLRAGLIVELVAELDDNGAIQGKVDSLTVTSLTQDKKIGMVPAADAKGAGVTDGFGDNATNDAAAKRAKHSTHATGKKAAPRSQVAGTYRIIGKLNVGRNGAMTVVAGPNQLPFELSDQAKIGIDVADLSLASRGNDVSVKGYLIQGKQGMMQAAEIQVKLPEPQVAADPEPSARPKSKNSAGRAKKGQDEPLPESGGEQ